MHLGVGPLRPDGFHELRTVYLAVSLFDTVTVRPRRGAVAHRHGEGSDGATPSSRPTAATSSGGPPSCSPEHAGVPADAASEIDKSIPAAAGLAGGSADAAAALVALDALWGTRADPRRPRRPRRPAGQRRPVQPARRGGAGHRPRRAALAGAGPARAGTGCSGIAGDGLSTPAVYAELDRLRAEGRVPDGDASWPRPSR